MPLIAGALAAIVVTGLIYMHPAFSEPHPVLRVVPSAIPPILPARYLASYDFLSAAAGWALVEEGTTAAPRFWVFKTTDAARHWQRQFAGSAMSTNAGPLKIQFFDRNNGLIGLGGTDVVYRTADGGVHWTSVVMPTFSFSSMYFSDRLHGWILGTVLSPDPLKAADFHFFSTTDAGDRWVALPQPPAWQFAGNGGFSNIAFRGPSEGWMGGGTPDRATVYSSIDGGMTWRAHTLPVTSGKGGFATPIEADVYLLPGAGVLASTTDDAGNPVGLASFDGGSNWRRLAPPPGSTQYGDFIFQDTFHWWAMRFGTLFKSSDGGQTWRQVSIQLDDWDYLPQVIDAKHAWAQLVAPLPGGNAFNGTGLATTGDGGLHWSPVNVPNPS